MSQMALLGQADAPRSHEMREALRSGGGSPSCRIAVAIAIMTHAPRSEARDVLVAGPANSNLYVSLLAVNALEHLGDAAYPVAHRLRKAIEADPRRPAQGPTWVVNSRDAIVDRIGVNAAAAPST